MAREKKTERVVDILIAVSRNGDVYLSEIGWASSKATYGKRALDGHVRELLSNFLSDEHPVEVYRFTRAVPLPAPAFEIKPMRGELESPRRIVNAPSKPSSPKPRRGKRRR